ncbi:vWA domain-containing protein [Oligella urethralis]|uniref:von Willebrand factor A n=1 Tax=Oligella urethralis DNF00040 TaxID=1401065 RepID=A0A095Z0A3_9BURK|nr:VWA domain-containing protein [Oligella urethralis]KGF28120.1 von Willebrand factor A [Oligella urethralis DNF00040]
MLINFFYLLRQYGIPVSINELLTLIDLLRRPLMAPTLDDFYRTARMTMVKDESHFDRYDQAFAAFVSKAEPVMEQFKEIPEHWLLAEFKKHLSEEQKAAIEKHGWEKLMELFKERLAEQKERHAGGSKWIGTGGTSPFGHSGYHPEGIRIGGTSAGHRTAVKVWEERHFREYDSQQELGTRNFKMALRRLRRFGREGAVEELDLEGTIRGTAKNAGHLDLQMVPARHNTVKVLMLLDSGGSMDDHIAIVEELFSAARSEFKHFEAYYFHNCLYERVWRYQAGRRVYKSTWDLLRSMNEDWRLIFVGDAAMSPYEIIHPGGSVEHYNKEAGGVWLKRAVEHWPKSIWLNPNPQTHWQYYHSTRLIYELLGGRMYGLSISAIDEAMRLLAK